MVTSFSAAEITSVERPEASYFFVKALESSISVKTEAATTSSVGEHRRVYHTVVYSIHS